MSKLIIADKIIKIYKLEREILDLERISEAGEFTMIAKQKEVDFLIDVVSKIKQIQLLREEVERDLKDNGLTYELIRN